MKYYFAMFVSRCVYFLLKLVGKDATVLPGKVAIKICPKFLKYVKKPPTIIGVTGTNGKTTVCNMLIDILEDNGYKILSNRKGANVNFGLASSFISNRKKYDIAILEIDERSSKLIYPYIKPNYLICTSFFRDSIKRNAHSEYIINFINEVLPTETILIMNADDLLSTLIGINNPKIYYGIDKLSSDLKESNSIVNDITICPKCHSKLEYDYVKYHHIGRAKCPKCDFGSPDSNYLATDLDFTKGKFVLRKDNKAYTYSMISNSIFNIYNQVAAISLLTELKMHPNDIKRSLSKINIVETRYTSEIVDGIEIITHLAKGQNPVACSRVFDYVKKESGNKEIILLLDDIEDNKKSSENITWLYDTDFEFLNDESIKKVIVCGPRARDNYFRLLVANIDKSKIEFSLNEMDSISYVDTNVDKIFILHDLHANEIGVNVKNSIIDKIKGEHNGNRDSI